VRTLILLRHAKSDWSGNERDVDRPLARRGRRQAPAAGTWLAANIDRIDLAVVSPAARARATWELVAGELAERPEVSFDDRVYAASEGELLGVLQEYADRDVVVLLGHNPGLEDLAHRLSGEWVELPTSAIAVLDLVGGLESARVRAAGRPPT